MVLDVIGCGLRLVAGISLTLPSLLQVGLEVRESETEGLVVFPESLVVAAQVDQALLVFLLDAFELGVPVLKVIHPHVHLSNLLLKRGCRSNLIPQSPVQLVLLSPKGRNNLLVD